MGALFIKDSKASQAVERAAKAFGLTKAETVLRAVEAMEANAQRHQRNADAPEWLQQFWRDNPLPAPTGLKADKAFFDWLSGEEDVPDVVR